MEPLYTCPQCTVLHEQPGPCLVCRPIPPRPAPVLPSGGPVERPQGVRAVAVVAAAKKGGR